ncbi:aquaporin-like protein [Aspergillus indologenus CBS 114.80]|uniref:Aquaporin-like protein n=1 Tax=Aspergillus indologenus CBS 114.80 TaxID=1450541 RepID=A0A2V5IMF1_9EURO|nr:aquaporin-like protein [Aspergillus indologenus CBS 114.80]
MDKVYYSYMADPVIQSSITLASASKNLEAAVDGLNLTEGESTPQPTPPRWSRIRHVFRYAFSEFFGTMIMMLFGDGVVAQVLLSEKQKGEYQSITWGWGLGVMLGVYVSSPSGSHLNPAVTLASCLLRRFPWRRFPIYLLSQVLGAMCGAAIVYANYRSAIDAYEGGSTIRTVPGYSSTATAGIFSTYPAPFMTRTGMFFSEFIASAILMFGIFAVKDNTELKQDNAATPTTTTAPPPPPPPPPPTTNPRLPLMMPLAMFFLIFGIGACFGWETGYAINLARDFGPRLVAYMIGYGTEVWTAGGYYFWYARNHSPLRLEKHIPHNPHPPTTTTTTLTKKNSDQIPMIAPFLGCAVGGWLYDVFIYTGADSVVHESPLFGLGRCFVHRWKVRSGHRSRSQGLDETLQEKGQESMGRMREFLRCGLVIHDGDEQKRSGFFPVKIIS